MKVHIRPYQKSVTVQKYALSFSLLHECDRCSWCPFAVISRHFPSLCLQKSAARCSRRAAPCLFLSVWLSAIACFHSARKSNRDIRWVLFLRLHLLQSEGWIQASAYKERKVLTGTLSCRRSQAVPDQSTSGALAAVPGRWWWWQEGLLWERAAREEKSTPILQNKADWDDLPDQSAHSQRDCWIIESRLWDQKYFKGQTHANLMAGF